MTRDDTDRTAVPVPTDVHEGLEAVRLSGLTNMLDRPAVARIAAAMGYEAIRCPAAWSERSGDSGLFRSMPPHAGSRTSGGRHP